MRIGTSRFTARRKLSWRKRRNPVIHPRPGSDLDRVRTTKQIIHIADMRVGGAATTAIVELAGARTFLNVPMLKDGELIGTIGIYRQHVRPLPTSRSSWLKTSPRKPSSPSRTRGCSASYANRFSSRPQPPRCSRLSAGRPSICNRSSNIGRIGGSFVRSGSVPHPAD